jgi:predicted nucleic-acid-binding protein
LIGVDTNVLLRVLVEDNVAQLHAANALIDSADRDGDPLLVSPIVIVELEWVMRKLYDRNKDQILDGLDRLRGHANIVIDDAEAVESAIKAWRTGKADLADYLISALARARGARTTMTFDRDAAETLAFTLLPHDG